MSRWKAAAVHLAISFCIGLTLAGFLALTWYPPEYAWAMGGLGLLLILAAVDVCVGPLLTLVAWDTKKPSLRFDMAVIVLLQLAALGYGLYAIFQSRPVYAVFAGDRFQLLTAPDVPDAEGEHVKYAELRSLPVAGPKIIAAKPPSDESDRTTLMIAKAMGGAEYFNLPRYFVPYAELAAEAAGKARPIAALSQRGGEASETLSAFLRERKLESAQVGYLPLQGKAHNLTVLLDKATGEVLDIVAIDPR